MRSSSSQVKAAFTRAYNRKVHLMPYSLQVVKKGRRGGGGGGGESELGGEDVDNEAWESEEEGLKADAMIKVRALTAGYRCWSSCALLANGGRFYLSLLTCDLCLVPLCSRRRSKQPRSQRRKRRKILGKGKERGKDKAKGRNDQRRKTLLVRLLLPSQTVILFLCTCSNL